MAMYLQPGDQIDTGVEPDGVQLEREDLRRALDIGIDQIERGEYSAYTLDTLHELVKAERRKQLGA